MPARRLAALLAALLLAGGVTGATPPGPTPGPPVLVVVAIDGLRWDAPSPAATPALVGLAARGGTTERLVPSFPTKTFPNFYTILTGLAPGRHGVVANSMRDPELGAFAMADRAAVADGRWWGGEPLWVTLERQGGRAAPHEWPGSEAEIGGVRPTWWAPYDHGRTLDERIARALDLLRLPPARRPGLVTLYTPEVDSAGHDFGPDAPETRRAIADADASVGRLLDGLAGIGLGGAAHVAVVSDHGMAAVDPARTVFLEELIDLDDVEIVDWSPLLALRPAPGRLAAVRAGIERSPWLRVFTPDEAPPEWRYSGSPRLQPLMALVAEGGTISTRAYAASRSRFPGRGNHGYDPALPSMGAWFAAAGPRLRTGVVLSPLENVHLYELFCAILGLDPAPNDGDPARTRALLREAARGPASRTPGSVRP